MNWRIVLGCAAACSVLTAHSDDTMVERALRQLAEAPPASPESFEFVVLGDSRSTEPVVLPEVFHRAIQEWNVLEPAFVIDAGDLILGGAAEGLGPQWDEFERVTGHSTAPFIPAPGNHDVSDAATEQIYLDRIGPTKFSFDYGNAQFIVLNTEEVGAVNRISDEQITWLEGELESTEARHIFIFMHKPYFAFETWDERWSMVADVLKGHPVRAVFGSHWHMYRDYGERDGVRYVVTGGGGAEIHYPWEEGGFPHYLLVRVRGGEVDWAVIEPGSIHSDTVVTAQHVEEIQKARNEYVRTSHEVVSYGEPFDRSVKLFIENPSNSAYASTIEWDVPEGWLVEPASAPYEAAANATTELEFHIAANTPADVKYPVPTAKTVWKAAQHGGAVAVRRPMDLIPSAAVPKASSPITIDGNLDDWPDALELPLPYGWAFDVTHRHDLDARIKLAWDDENLYLAVIADDDEFHQPHAGDIVWSADGVQLFLGRWEWGLTLTKAGPEVFLYKGVNRSEETVNTAVHLAITQDGSRTIYEAAFPASELTPLELAPGGVFDFSLVANDLDPSHPERPRHWAELTPGVGDSIPGSPKALFELQEATP